MSEQTPQVGRAGASAGAGWQGRPHALELSERRACRVTGQHRSTQRRLPARGRGDDALRTALRTFSRGHPRWGYRRAWATGPADAGIPRRLREEGWGVYCKRVQRLWREEGLRVPVKRRKRQRLGDSAVPAARLRAERPNHVWALDFQFDQTADGRVLKLLNIVDEHTREALAIVAARSITADATAATLEGMVARRGTAPAYIRCDIQSGPTLRMLAGPPGRSPDRSPAPRSRLGRSPRRAPMASRPLRYPRVSRACRRAA